MQTFDTATSLIPRGNNQCDWTVPDGWQQGRGAWGGLVIGALIKAVVAAEPDSTRMLRSIAANIVAPAVVGEHVVTATLVRRGSAVSTWSASVVDATGAVVATAFVLLGASRSLTDAPEFRSWQLLEMPIAPPWETLEVVDASGLGPAFFQHLSPRVVSGIPMEGGRPEVLGWIDYREPVQPSAASLVSLADGWWVAGLVAMPQMRPIATISFAANLLVEPSTLAAGEPLLHHAFVSGAADGYTSEHRRLWTSDGRLAVDNVQSVVIIA